MNDFLDMNSEANELVENLKKLKKEVEAYKTSREQLSDLNKNLSKFIDETKELTEKSSKVIENISKLSPSRINGKLDEINKRVDTLSENNQETNGKLDEINKRVDTLSKSNQETNGKLDEINKRVDTFDTYVKKKSNEIRKTQKLLSNQIEQLTKAVELNSEAIKNKRFLDFFWRRKDTS